MAEMSAFPPGTTPGLEYLTQIDQLLIQQKVELLEAFTGWETANQYSVKNSMGQEVYLAAEKSGCCNRQCCGASRSFDMRISDHKKQEVLWLSRPLRCSCCWCCCCQQELEVQAPKGTTIGWVKQICSVVKPKFAVCDSSGTEQLRIVAPCCQFRCCRDVVFRVNSLDGTEVGQIRKQWTGLVKEALTDADYFSVTFPMDLDVHCKATMLAATFLIDFMFYEENEKHDAH